MRMRWMTIGLCLILCGALWSCTTATPATTPTAPATATTAPAATETATTAATATAMPEATPTTTATTTLTPEATTTATTTTTPEVTTTATTTTTPGATTTTTVTPAPGAAWQPDGIITPGEYARSTEAAGVTLYWRTDSDYLYGALSAQTTGWVSVGLDPENRMQGANFIFGYVQNGQATVLDMYGVQPSGPGSHPPDETLGGTNDIVASGGREEGGVTVIEFQIPLDSDDAYDKKLDDSGGGDDNGPTYPIILAMGTSDNPAEYHGARGYSQITIE